MSDTTTNNASTTTVNNEVTQNNEEVSLPTLSPSLFFSSNLTRSPTLNVRFETGEEDYR